MKSIYIIAGMLLVWTIADAQGNYEDGGLSYSKDGKLLNGRCIQIDDENDTKKVLYYVDGQLQGEFMVYASNGNLLEKGSYTDGEKDGKWTSWTIEGIKTGQVSFEDGLKDGKWQIWDEKGTLRYVMFYELGQKVGTWQVYNQDGELQQEKDYTRTL